MKNLLHILFFCFTALLQSQNIMQKTFSINGIEHINVIGEKMFKISVETKPVDVIKVYSRVEGENNENVILLTEKKDNNLNIEVELQPTFIDFNDKLSAHKVLSIELVLVIPKNLSLFGNIYNANIIVKGQYKNVLINSNQGNCSFYKFKGKAKIFTREGNVFLETNYADITTRSKNGLVKKDIINLGPNKIEINTINGNITITKSQ